MAHELRRTIFGSVKFAAIETATEWCSVALWVDGGIVSLERRAGNRQGEFVLPMLEKLFERARVSACKTSTQSRSAPGPARSPDCGSRAAWPRALHSRADCR